MASRNPIKNKEVVDVAKPQNVVTTTRLCHPEHTWWRGPKVELEWELNDWEAYPGSGSRKAETGGVKLEVKEKGLTSELEVKPESGGRLPAF